MTRAEFYIYQEQTFDSFIKKVIENEGKDARKEIARHAEQETPFSQLAANELDRLSAVDVYELESMTFLVKDETVTVSDVLLGQALAQLPPKRRDVILLSYFMDKNDPQIGELLHLDTSTIHYRRHTALTRLKDILEAMDYDGT